MGQGSDRYSNGEYSICFSNRRSIATNCIWYTHLSSAKKRKTVYIVTMDDNVYITTSPIQTKDLGEKIASSLKGGQVLLLHGDLGSGKTTFSQGVAHGLGVNGRVTSPTFLIIRSYTLENNPEVKKLYHIDAYRLSGEKETEELGLTDILSDSSAVVLCEWPEKIEQLLPEKRTDIFFTYIDEDTRKITIQNKR